MEVGKCLVKYNLPHLPRNFPTIRNISLRRICCAHTNLARTQRFLRDRSSPVGYTLGLKETNNCRLASSVELYQKERVLYSMAYMYDRGNKEFYILNKFFLVYIYSLFSPDDIKTLARGNKSKTHPIKLGNNSIIGSDELFFRFIFNPIIPITINL